MIPWSLVASAEIPGGGGELRLVKRGAEFSIMSGRIELMNSRRGASEGALATISCQRMRALQMPHILIGGLGMGFTLRAALDELGPDARITVAELVPEVVAWARAPMAELFGSSLADKRVRICEADVAVLIGSGCSTYDAILLDVDNGPQGLTRSANDRLYDAKGLSAAKTALRPGGILALWSSGPNASYAKRLRSIGFDVEEVAVRANGAGGGARHLIWIASLPSPSRARANHHRER